MSKILNYFINLDIKCAVCGKYGVFVECDEYLCPMCVDKEARAHITREETLTSDLLSLNEFILVCKNNTNTRIVASYIDSVMYTIRANYSNAGEVTTDQQLSTFDSVLNYTNRALGHWHNHKEFVDLASEVAEHCTESMKAYNMT